MFEIFSSKKGTRFIGLDFGTSSIKMIELSYLNHQISLENYGTVDLNSLINTNIENNKLQAGAKALSYEQKLNSALKSLIEKMKIGSQPVYVSLPGFVGLITIIELPQMQESELAKAIQFEAHKYIPTSLDEVVMSWEIIQQTSTDSISLENQNNNKKIKVLLVAAPKRDVERYNRLVAGTDLNVSAIELETFSIARALVGEDMGTFLIIDIGARSTNIILVDKGVVSVNRNIDAGGNEITDTIMDSMNISQKRAEIFKKGTKDLLNSTESPIIFPVLELIAGESLRTINSYLGKNKDSRIDSVILSGGTSKMKGIEEYFAKMLSVKIIIGNPWKRIVVDEKVKSFVSQMGGAFSVAIGLAFRGIDDHKRN